MLSTVTAAELQFHFDTAERNRERAALAAVRDRRVAVARLQARTTVVVRRAPATWPRPIVASQAACAA